MAMFVGSFHQAPSVQTGSLALAFELTVSSWGQLFIHEKNPLLHTIVAITYMNLQLHLHQICHPYDGHLTMFITSASSYSSER